MRIVKLAAIAVMAGALVGAVGPNVETERNRAAVARGMQAWADGTGSPYDLLADDARWTIAGNSQAAKTYPGKEAFMR